MTLVQIPQSTTSRQSEGYSGRVASGKTVIVVVGGCTVFCMGLGAMVALGGIGGPLKTLGTWLPFILWGFSLNIVMSVISMILATMMGFGFAILRLNPFAPVSLLATLTNHIFRNTPWIVIVFAAMLLFPYELSLFGGKLEIPPVAKAIVGLAIPVAANVSDIVIGAIRTVPAGQWEAAEGLAFSRKQILFQIILPQAFRSMIPPWMNWYALLALSTPITSILGVQEVVGRTRTALASAGGSPDLLVPFYLFVMVLFFVCVWPVSVATKHLEAHIRGQS